MSGSMIALDTQTANLHWFQQHDPIINTSSNEKLNFSSIFLPNPATGQLYSLKTTEQKEFELSRLDHTIPDLVLKTPFISKEKILYTGRKADSWFIINTLTGRCRTVVGRWIYFWTNFVTKIHTYTQEKKINVFVFDYRFKWAGR